MNFKDFDEWFNSLSKQKEYVVERESEKHIMDYKEQYY